MVCVVENLRAPYFVPMLTYYLLNIQRDEILSDKNKLVCLQMVL